MNKTFNQPVICPIMVGRDRPAQVLTQLFEQASHGQGQIALINGEAGIGKSRLVREHRAHLSRAEVLQGGCYELDQRQPYAPFIEMLQTLLPLHPTSPLAGLMQELTRLLPGLSTDFAGFTEGDSDQRRLAQTLTQLFGHLAWTHPLVIIIEDLHWCDDASLEYLAYLAQHLSNQPILLILTWRSDGLTASLTRCLAVIERTRLATEINLTSLSLEELDVMLGAIFEQTHMLRADVLASLHTLTEGNPFFIEEILRSLIPAGNVLADETWEHLSPDQLPIPRTVQASVQQRTDRLSPAVNEVLTLAAVIGRRFDFSLLQHLTRQSEAELLQCLRELIKAQLVVEASPDIFVFRHALTQQAVYYALLARERRVLHRAVAEAIIALYPEKQHDTFLTDLAYHCYQGELWIQSMNFSMEAGQRAQMLYSPTAAVEYYTTALLSARHLAIAPSPSLYQTRGKMYEMLGEFEAARGDYEQTIETAQALQMVGAQAQGLLDLGFLWTARDYEKAGEYYRQAAELARGSDDSLMLANNLNRIGLWHTHSEHPFDGLQHHEEALSIYRQLEDISGIGETLDLLGVTAFMAGDILVGWRYFHEAIALCRTTGNRPVLATHLQTASIRGGALLVDTLVWIPASQQECVDQCEEAIQIAQDIRLPATEAYAHILLAHVLGWQGTFGRALAEGEAAFTLARDIDHRMWQLNAQVVLGVLHLELLDFSAALDQLEQAFQNVEGMGSLYMRYLVSSVLSRIYIAQNQPERAGQILDRIITPDLPTQTLAQRLIWTAQAERMLAMQQPETALGIVERLIMSARNRTDDTVIPRLWYLQGKALMTLRRSNEAENMLQAGHAAAITWGNRPIAWRIGVELGNLYLTNGQREEAQDVLDTTRGIVHQIADELPVGALRDLFFAQAMKNLPQNRLISERKASKRIFEGLTQREREVAALVAQGKTNHAIANALTLSERTIEKHIENIMGKLGFNGRSQIAVWAAEKKLGDQRE